MADPFPDYSEPFADPFAAFVMSEFHAPMVEDRVRYEELAAVPGQVECSESHDPAIGTTMHDVATGLGDACPSCGAAV